MRYEVFVILFFSFALIFYWLGFTSPIMQLYNQQGGANMDYATFLQKVISNVLLSPSGLATLLVAGLSAALVSYATGFGIFYIAPLVILFAILQFTIFPISFIFDPTLPDVIRIPLIVITNLMLVLSAVSFIRGGT